MFVGFMIVIVTIKLIIIITEIINSISKARFAPTSDNYIFSRDYLSV